MPPYCASSRSLENPPPQTNPFRRSQSISDIIVYVRRVFTLLINLNHREFLLLVSSVTETDNRELVVSLMVAYIFKAMTNLANDIRLKAFEFLDLVLEFYPPSLPLYAEKNDAGQRVLHAFEDDMPARSTGLPFIIKKLKDLLVLLQNLMGRLLHEICVMVPSSGFLEKFKSSLCCLYYFSHLDSHFLKTISRCCLCPNLDPHVLF
ncbi:hypothetical protein K1719_028621 [Acacia pycnantha]|nr:hypothetical protein K1719_028621 [Acacia pycnantha]